MVQSPSSKYGSGVRRFLDSGAVEDRLEGAPEHALPSEGHVALRLQALVRHDLFPSLIAGFLVRPFDEGENDLFAVLGLHGPVEVGDFAPRNIVGQRFDYSGRAMLAEDLRHFRSELAIGVALVLRNRDDEAV